MLRKIFKKSNQIVTSCDMFSNTQLLRYKENPEYKSANGGICSLAVIMAFVIIFTQTILNTFDKTVITSQTTLFEEVEPTNFKTTDTPFLFAIGLANFNLNDPYIKYFNIEVAQKISNPKKTITYTLVPCSKDVWTKVAPTVGDTFDRLKLNQWLCMPENITMEFEGKFSSNVFKYIKITVKKCNISGSENRTCVNQSIIDTEITNNMYVSFNYYFLNTIINPDDQQYLGTYLQDRNFFPFTMDTGTKTNLFISSFKIQTDDSLWPVANMVEDVGGLVYEPSQNLVIKPAINNTQYIQLYIRKSSLSLSIQRSFKKYDDTLSYIGGLFSSIMAALFIMAKYNQYSYEIQISSNIYKETRKKKIGSKYFNIFTFFTYSFYCVLDFFGCPPQWQRLKQFDCARQEIGKQLDIKLVLRKLSFLEDCMEFLFQDFELKCLHLKGKLTLSEAAKIRKRFSSRVKLLKICKKAELQQTNKTLLDDNLGNKVQNMQMIQISKIKQMFKEDPNNQNNNKLIETEISKETSGANSEEPNKDEEVVSQDCSEDSEKEEKQFYDDMIRSLQVLEIQANKGKERCLKIYKSLDRSIRKIAVKNSIEDNSTSIIKIEAKQNTEQKMNFNQTFKDFDYDFQSIK